MWKVDCTTVHQGFSTFQTCYQKQLELQLPCEWRTAFLSSKFLSVHCAVRLSMLTGLKLDIQMSVVKLTQLTLAVSLLMLLWMTTCNSGKTTSEKYLWLGCSEAQHSPKIIGIQQPHQCKWLAVKSIRLCVMPFAVGWSWLYCLALSKDWIRDCWWFIFSHCWLLVVFSFSLSAATNSL